MRTLSIAFMVLIAFTQTFASAQTATSFQIDPISSPKNLNVTFPVTIKAVDTTGSTVSSYTGTANLVGLVGTTGTLTVGTSSDTHSGLMSTYYKSYRAQMFLRSDEITSSGMITAISLNVWQMPGATLNNWTIRMQDTSSGFTYGWKNTGWTTVYQNNETVNRTGWVTFVFPKPFRHDPGYNLLIDFSHSNPTAVSNGGCRRTVTPDQRIFTAGSHNTQSDPLTWQPGDPAGEYSGASSMIYNVRLEFGGQPVTMTPATTGAFTAGVWNGTVNVGQVDEAIRLRASAAGGLIGFSNRFDVTDPTDIIPPDSHACWLYPVQYQSTLTVECSAYDNRSGIRETALWYRRNGGAWTRYPGNYAVNENASFDTTQTGGDGRYEFYTVATDKSGNVEAVPSYPDVITTVITSFPGSRVYVNSNGSGWANGSNWANAAPTIEVGFDVAAHFGIHEIWAQAGTYYSPVTMPSGIALYGGFAGTESQISERNVSLHPSVIDISSYEGYLTRRNAVIISGVSNTRFDGFTVTGADNQSSTEFGGGIYCVNAGASNVVANCTVSGNKSASSGGGMSFRYAQVQVSDCTIYNNTASQGAGAYGYRTTNTLTRCTFRANRAGTGAGIAYMNSGVTVTTCVFEDNVGSGDGGGGYFFGTKAVFNDCTFSRNTCLTGSGPGVEFLYGRAKFNNCTFSLNRRGPNERSGALNFSGSAIYVEVRHCSFFDNFCSGIMTAAACLIEDCLITGNQEGGLWVDDYYPTVLNRCVISGNSSDAEGGGVRCRYDLSIMTDCLITGNYSSVGGGGIGCLCVAEPTLINCTVSGNTAPPEMGGGMFCTMDDFGYGSNHPTAINTIFSDNSSYGIQFSDRRSTPTLTNCLFYNNAGADYKGYYLYDFKTGAAQLNTLPGCQGNVDGNPHFLPGIGGTWSAPPVFNSATSQTTLACAGTTLFPNALAGKLINPNKSQRRQARIVSNTANTIVVGGDVTGFVASGNAFETLDYRLGSGSGAIDVGSSVSAPANDLDLRPRPVDIPGHGSDGGQAKVDIGAYEAQPDDIVNLDLVWVDYNWHAAEVGSFNLPFNTLNEGAAAVTSARTVRIKASASPEQVRITKPMRVESWGGTARIGAN